jgi:glycosyl transferase family 25
MGMIDAVNPPGAGPVSVFVINLAKDAERRSAMQHRLNAIGLRFTFFEAINGKDLTEEDCEFYDAGRRRRYFGRDMTPGELGVLLSHSHIYEKIVQENIETALVLEDDVVFEDDFLDVLRALLTTKTRWDIIRFLGSEKIYRLGCRKIEPLVGKYWLARLPGTHGGAHGYLVTLRAAKVLLEHTRRSWVPIDTLQGRCWNTGLESLVVHPTPLYPDPAAGTTIGDARFDKTVRLTGWERALYPAFRFWYKLGETVGKRCVYWGAWRRDRRYWKDPL